MDSCFVESILAKMDQSNNSPRTPVRIRIENSEVVGNCPKCGSPIYGPNSTPSGSVPSVLRTCSCFAEKSFSETIRYT